MVTDADVLAVLRPALIEDANWSSGLWSAAEVLDCLRKRQDQFLRETLCLTAIATLPITPTVATVALPDDWISTVTVLYHNLTRDDWTPLEATDAWEFDHLLGSRTPADDPVAYSDADVVDRLTLRLSPTPQGPGELELLYVSTAEAIDGTGQVLDVPDDWALTTLKYGVLADLLQKEGRGQDLTRARYAGLWWQEGVTLARVLLEGWA